MRKLAIMFVMLLGSVATIQAQSFSFACSTAAPGYGQIFIPAGFTQAQADVLFALGLETESSSLLFTHPVLIGDGAELTVSSFIRNDGITFEVDDPNGSGEFMTEQNLTFEAAIVYVRSLLGLPVIVINDIRGIRLSNGGIDVATSFENPYEALIGTSIDFDLRAWTNLEDGTLPSDVVFSLPAVTHALHNDDVSIDGDILTVVFNSSSVFQIRIYASSEITGQSKSDITFLTESFRGTN